MGGIKCVLVKQNNVAFLVHYLSNNQCLPFLPSFQVIPSSVMTVTSRTAEDFTFDLAAHYGTELLRQGCGVILGDGIKLLPADDCSAGKAEFYR